MLLSEDDEVVQRFLLDALNPSLRERIQVRSTWADRFDRNASIGKDRIEILGERVIKVTHYNRAFQLLALNVFEKRGRLLLHPFAIC